jgi:DNA-binding transcriptional ArsR family regulator
MAWIGLGVCLEAKDDGERYLPSTSATQRRSPNWNAPTQPARSQIAPSPTPPHPSHVLDMQAFTCILFLVVGDVFKALADPTRRTILDELAERDGQTLFELCARLATKHQLGSSRQAISQHLAVLEDSGLVETRKEGRYKFHAIKTDPLENIAKRWLEPRRREDS